MEKITIKVWNDKGNYAGIIIARSFGDIDKISKIYSRFEYVHVN